MQATTDFASFFSVATAKAVGRGFAPYPVQARLAALAEVPAVLALPTGLGKTEAAVLPWLWRRMTGRGGPRRLIYTLPTRALVEQTFSRIDRWLTNLASDGMTGLPEVARLLGGDVDDKWIAAPERSWIVVGTQDMLLSRALNRGYAESRMRWPVSFALVNNDAYWVIDEVQLQDVGAITAAQLQGLREKLGTCGITATTFVSATLDRTWIDTVDHVLDGRTEVALGADDLAIEAVRRIVDARKTLSRLDAAIASDVVDAVRANHRPGELTLVILNTVDRAREIYTQLTRSPGGADVVLLHSRFRPRERVDLLTRAVPEGDVVPAAGRIVISTQVVEAGIDMSATTLLTDVAPWSSLVQRFGRCNRRGTCEDARIFWLDRGEPDTKSALPYDAGELRAARERLTVLEGDDVAPSRLAAVPQPIHDGAMLRRTDLLDLFDTTPDLSGRDVDVSRFIRVGDDHSVFLLWRDAPPTRERPPRRDELCAAPIGDAKKLLERFKTAGERGGARVIDPFAHRDAHEWVAASRDDIRPGRIVWIDARLGGYDPVLGMSPGSLKPVTPVADLNEPMRLADESELMDRDAGTQIGGAVLLRDHLDDAVREARSLLEGLPDILSPALHTAVPIAARWHDVGKAHPVFQTTMRKTGLTTGGPWAKSRGTFARHERPRFRHELSSLMAWLYERSDDAEETGLVAYLIAAHHGHVRAAVRTFPGEEHALGEASVLRTVLGHREGDVVPEVELGDGQRSPRFTVALDVFSVGTDGAKTWTERVARLLADRELGPFVLAYAETLVRVADWRASAAPSHVAAPHQAEGAVA